MLSDRRKEYKSVLNAIYLNSRRKMPYPRYNGGGNSSGGGGGYGHHHHGGGAGGRGYSSSSGQGVSPWQMGGHHQPASGNKVRTFYSYMKQSSAVTI